MSLVKVPSKPCPGCMEVVVFEVDAEDYRRWENGELIQQAFPYLSNSEREKLITGFCDSCWKELFAEEEEG